MEDKEYISRLENALAMARTALVYAKNRFLDPKFGCVWEDAAQDIEDILFQSQVAKR